MNLPRNHVEKAGILQRIVRGWLGRREAIRRGCLAAALEALRFRSAARIQGLVRGRLARKHAVADARRMILVRKSNRSFNRIMHLARVSRQTLHIYIPRRLLFNL